MSRVKYKDIYLNINSKTFSFDETKYKAKIEELQDLMSVRSGIEYELLEYKYNMINKQYDDYLSTKNLSKKELMRRRRDEIGDLLDDKHHHLIRNNLLSSRHEFLYDVDLSDKLDIVIAYTFNVKLSVVRDKLRFVCNKYGVSLEYMSRSLLCQDDLYYIDNCIPFRELWNLIPEVRLFLEDIIKVKLNTNVSLIDCVCSTKYTDFIRCEDESEEFITAFTLKLLLGASEMIRYFLENFETTRRDENLPCTIYSQYLCGFVIGSIRELDCRFKIPSEVEDLIIEGYSI